MTNVRRIGLCVLLLASLAACGKKKENANAAGPAKKPVPEKPRDGAKPPSGSVAVVSVEGDRVRLRFPDGKEARIPAAQVDYSLVGPAILDVYCVKCHQGAGAKGGTPLDGYANASRSAARVLDRIKPGGGMPPSGQPATEAEVKVIEFWIDNKTPEKAAAAPADKPETPESGEPPPSAVSFADVKSALLDPHCLACHDGGFPSLASAEDLKALVNVSQPERSKLYRVIDDGVMPPSGPLEPAEKTRALKILKAWIVGGMN